MNKKGFTLIELLAVVILLSLIIVLALPKITNSVNNKKEDIDKVTKNIIESAAKLYVSDNPNSFQKKEENTYCITLNTLVDNEYLKGPIEYNNQDITNSKVVKLTYDNGFNYELVNKHSCEKTIPAPKSFAEDSWETIAKNVKAGNLSKYNVGDRKEIALTGFTNEEKDENGNNVVTYTIRIANTSTPSECKTEGFSQTACGFVIEFEDIILNSGDNAKMNLTATNVGGWKDSKMRTYVNNDIYNALPDELKSVIIPTYVVSSHGSTSGETNFVSEDKLYLLATGEVWEQGTSNTINNDTARENTRQLDYYKNYKNEDGSIGVTINNYAGAIKKFDGSEGWWWLRSAHSTDTSNFFSVDDLGCWNFDTANIDLYGVAVAFRIG